MTRAGWIRVAIVLGAIAALELVTRAGWVDPHTVIPPSASDARVSASESTSRTSALTSSVRRSLSQLSPWAARSCWISVCCVFIRCLIASSSARSGGGP